MATTPTVDGLVAFEARKVVPCSVSRRSLVRVEGATYSVPSSWQGLGATAYVGPETVEIVCREERESYARERFGGKAVRYRHYLGELSRKPQALRQVAPELLAELGEPFAGLWRLLVDRHGPADAARVFARILEAIGAHGEACVAQAVARSLEAGTLRTLPVASVSAPAPCMEVPAPLRGIVVETTPAAAFDALLAEASDE